MMNHSPASPFATALADCPVWSRAAIILTIDDDPAVTRALARRFRRYNVVVLQAGHGMHGVWLATTKQPDVIITDLRMPQGQGQDVVDHLKRSPKTCHIPIIVLTGLHDDGLEDRLWDLGVDGYLTKPVAFEDLCEVVRRFVDLQERMEDD